MTPKGTGRALQIRLVPVLFMLVFTLGIALSSGGAFARLPSANTSLSYLTSGLLNSENAGIPSQPFDCSRISRLGIDKQMNIRASQIMAACGYTSNPTSIHATQPENSWNLPKGVTQVFNPLLGGTDGNTILPDGAYPKVTQSETMVWAHGSTIMVNYNDSRTSNGCYAGLSYSTNSGATWTSGQPFCSGHGTNYGDPIVVWDNAHNKWVAGDLATGCGGQGLGIWTSTNNGVSWSVGPCAHTSSQDDRESLYVDNNPSSPNYGTMFMSYANYSLAGPPISVIRSTDGGATWSSPVNLAPPSGVLTLRNVQDTGGTNGTFYIAAMNEGGGGLSNRTNYMYRSTNGGVTWSAPIAMGPAFAAPGVAMLGYFALMFPTIWRYMGWGQPAGGPNGVVHYAYTQHGAGADPGDIYYVRSTDSGLTWSSAIKLNQDATTNGNWQPSVAVTTQGGVLVSWYDGREAASSSCGSPGTSTACYRRWGRVSLDNGATWQADGAIGDAISGLPAQPDTGVQTTYEGDYDYSSADGTMVYTCWNDGRVQINGTSQQDVFCDKVSLAIGTPTPTVTGTPPTATPTFTITLTPCVINFLDVRPDDYYYAALQYLFCRNIISGYVDGRFRPNDNTTRGQLSKIVVLAREWPINTTGGPHFTDVTQDNVFYPFIETAVNQGIISGYDCGGPLEPCIPPSNRKYFRPGANITRAQLSKIIVLAMVWPTNTNGGPHFADVPLNDTFYPFIETAVNRGIISGYDCGVEPTEPCIPPSNRKYFRPGDNATRSQISKIVYQAILNR